MFFRCSLISLLLLVFAGLWGCDSTNGNPAMAASGEPAANTGSSAASEDESPDAAAQVTKPGAGKKLDAPNPLEGLPPLDQIPVQRPKVFDDHYPGSNDPYQRRIATEIHTSSIIEIDLPEQATPSPVVMRFLGPVEGLVLQGDGTPAVGDMNGLIEYLTRNAKTDRERAEALFFFVRDEVKDWWYPAQGIDLTVEDLNVLIWGFGYGYCYDLGRLMAGLWAQAGFRSRVVGWPQHTVAEVFYDNAWHLYDLQHHTFYEKPDGQVASFEELKADGSLFYQDLNEYGLDPINYPPPHMVHWYSIANPVFQDSTEGGPWTIERDFRLDLRPGELLDIYWAEPGAYFHPDSWVVYYGLKTNDKNPPVPMVAYQEYNPARFIPDGAMVFEKVKAPNGKRGWAIDMQSPFMFTEGMFKVPGGGHLPAGWVEVFGRTHALGRLSHGTAHLTQYIAGSNAFRVIVELPEDKTPEEANLAKAFFETNLNISPIGMPALKGGLNRLPFRFKEGKIIFSLWFRDHGADLTLSDFKVSPENPKVGEYTKITYTVTNNGSGRSQPTSLSVFNNVTAFHSETTAKVGVQTVKPLDPGEKTEVAVYWRADKSMTWYGQNPYVQLIDAWLDMEKDTPDHDRRDNRRQDHILLRLDNGELPELPGYAKEHH